MLLTLILVIVVGFSSCSKDEGCKCKGDCHGTQCSTPCADDCVCTISSVSYDIVGTWNSPTENNEYLQLVFNKNGTGKYNIYYKNELNYELDYTYIYDKVKSSVKITFEDDDVETWNIKFINEKSMQTTINGEVISFTKK